MSETTLLRALKVVDEISRHPEGLGFSAIRIFLGNPSPTTVNKILKELLGMDVLQKTSGKTYVLGTRAYFWGKAAARSNDPMRVVRAHMRGLHEEFQASVNLFTCSQGSLFCLESFVAPHSPSMWSAGQSLALSLPVVGSVFFHDPVQLRDEGFLQQELAAHREEISLDDVKNMIREALQTRIQDDGGLFYPGMRRFAVPIREQERTVLVLGLGVLEARLNRSEIRDRIVSGMVEARESIEQRFNHQYPEKD
ncbi:transcriptional regulator, IclR family protein [Desulfonatronum sp. SC1]|uniref:transcriptional regulator, IclR family protein n=1 Tax=Desulfonatronum sp. SC1 TaxID=2109626 RepID=UPI000D305332|nr:transcriptional regulator, IclR family protein [Desulfonatronum sp. SC1]PTN38948.1 transcriptional regulator, IclR family protein [Desulfonatronum sp. SC1]